MCCTHNDRGQCPTLKAIKSSHCNKTSWDREAHSCWYQPCDRYAEVMSIIMLVQKNTKNYCQADQQIRRKWWKRPLGGLVSCSVWKQIQIPFSFFYRRSSPHHHCPALSGDMASLSEIALYWIFSCLRATAGVSLITIIFVIIGVNSATQTTISFDVFKQTP